MFLHYSSVLQTPRYVFQKRLQEVQNQLLKSSHYFSYLREQNKTLSGVTHCGGLAVLLLCCKKSLVRSPAAAAAFQWG